MANNQVIQVPAVPPSRIRVGINYPWEEYGWDFGPSPYAPPGKSPPPPWKTNISSRLQEFKKLGIFAVRWFILGDGTNYGTGLESIPPPLSPRFIDDFKALLNEFKILQMKLVPSLIDFHWFDIAQPIINGYTKKVSGYKGGRSNFIGNPNSRTLFFELVLEELLKVSENFSNVIYAWELINEPEWVKTISKKVMKEFIREGIGRINTRKDKNGNNLFRSTIGFAKWESLKEYDSIGLGVTLHQFHYYTPTNIESNRATPLPAHHFHKDWPIFIGELATAPAGSQGNWKPALEEEKDKTGNKTGKMVEVWRVPWSDPDPITKERDADKKLQNYLFYRLRVIQEKGYPCAFLWSARKSKPILDNQGKPMLDNKGKPIERRPDEATEWTDLQMEQVKCYTSGI